MKKAKLTTKELKKLDSKKKAKLKNGAVITKPKKND